MNIIAQEIKYRLSILKFCGKERRQCRRKGSTR